MNKKILDTNFLYALFTENDPLHLNAIDVSKELPTPYDFIIPTIVAAEVAVSGEKYIALLSVLVSDFEVIKETDLLFIEDNIPLNTKRVLKANDCLIIAIAHRLDAEIITFDKKLKKHSEKILDKYR